MHDVVTSAVVETLCIGGGERRSSKLPGLPTNNATPTRAPEF